MPATGRSRGDAPANARPSASAFAPPAVVSHTSGHACMTGIDTVMRSGGGFGELRIARMGEASSMLTRPGNSEQICPSGPIPMSAMSKEARPISLAHVCAKTAVTSSREPAPGADSSEVGMRTNSTPAAAWKNPSHAWSSLRSACPAGT